MSRNLTEPMSLKLPKWHEPNLSNVTVGNRRLSIEEVARVARCGTRVRLNDENDIAERVQASCDYITNAIESGKPIYGVTTGFGGMANTEITPEEATSLQNNLIWFLKAGAGLKLPTACVRAAMLLRINSHLQGASGIRLELIKRMIAFLNAEVTPHVCELGSIGASGDLVPLAQITGALIGLDESFNVDFKGREMSAIQALEILDLPRINLRPKEGLAMVNGTSVMTGIAANCVRDSQVILALAMGTHALMIQGLSGTNQSFHPFIHKLKPHFGQLWAASQMVELLKGS